MSRRLLPTLLLSLVALGPLGCLTIGLGGNGGGGDGTAGSDDDDEPSAEPGSCNDWKISYCEAVDLCGSVEEKSGCEDRAGWVVCQEDAPFASCQKKLDGIRGESECKEWPKDCEPEDIAERSASYDTCTRLYRAICEWRQYCNPLTTVEDCQLEMETTTPCSSYYSVNPDVAEGCIDGYQVVGCGESIPPECVTDEFLFR